jgi:DNA repair protein RadD
MAGRGMRPKSHTDHCLALDFAGVVATHGPITNIQTPDKAGQGNGEAPVKLCEQCNELVALACRECPACGFKFPPPKPPSLKLHNDDIMGTESQKIDIRSWIWRKHVSTAGKEMVAVTYYGQNLTDATTEYFCLLHGGYPAQKAMQKLATLARNVGVSIHNPYDLDEVINTMNNVSAPVAIKRKKDGKFYRITARYFNDE